MTPTTDILRNNFRVAFEHFKKARDLSTPEGRKEERDAFAAYKVAFDAAFAHIDTFLE